MLLGTEIGAALTTLEMFDVAVIGMNCATGPKEMNDGVRYLGAEFAQAGFGAAERRAAGKRWRRTPCTSSRRKTWRDYHKQFITEYGVRVVGGCCGTKPEHLKAVVDAVRQSRARAARREDAWARRRARTPWCPSISIPSR